MWGTHIHIICTAGLLLFGLVLCNVIMRGISRRVHNSNKICWLRTNLAADLICRSTICRVRERGQSRCVSCDRHMRAGQLLGVARAWYINQISYVSDAHIGLAKRNKNRAISQRWRGMLLQGKNMRYILLRNIGTRSACRCHDGLFSSRILSGSCVATIPTCLPAFKNHMRASGLPPMMKYVPWCTFPYLTSTLWVLLWTHASAFGSSPPVANCLVSPAANINWLIGGPCPTFEGGGEICSWGVAADRALALLSCASASVNGRHCWTFRTSFCNAW